MKNSKFIDFKGEKKQSCFQKRLTNFQLKLSEFYRYICIYFPQASERENPPRIHASFSPASFRGEETGSSVPLCRTQTLSLFMLPGESTRPLPVLVATPLPFASNPRLFGTPKLNSATKCTMTQKVAFKRIGKIATIQ